MKQLFQSCGNNPVIDALQEAHKLQEAHNDERRNACVVITVAGHTFLLLARSDGDFDLIDSLANGRLNGRQDLGFRLTCRDCHSLQKAIIASVASRKEEDSAATNIEDFYFDAVLIEPRVALGVDSSEVLKTISGNLTQPHHFIQLPLPHFPGTDALPPPLPDAESDLEMELADECECNNRRSANVSFVGHLFDCQLSIFDLNLSRAPPTAQWNDVNLQKESMETEDQHTANQPT
ncbi:hypothetical protein THAOC_28803, partial [Thalassiosira oceanica]